MTKDLQVKTGQKISSMQELVDSMGTLVPGGISTESDGMGWYSTAVSHKWPSVRRKRRSLPVCPRLWLLWLMSFTEPTCNIPKYKQQHSSWFLPLVKETEWVSSLSENISLFFICPVSVGDLASSQRGEDWRNEWMTEWMSGVPARRKELLVGCGAEVENEDQARSVHPPHSYPYPKAYCALSSPNSSCHSLLLELPLLLLPLPAATAEECKA